MLLQYYIFFFILCEYIYIYLFFFFTYYKIFILNLIIINRI
jgi:hypothetical protein